MTDARFETTPCLVCGEESALDTFFQQDATVVGVSYRHTLARCRTCGYVFVRPRLRPEVFREYYKQYYATNVVSHAESRWEQDTVVARRVLARLEKLGLPAGGRILEVGCGAGSFLEAAQKAGYKATGIEPSGDAVRFARARGLDALEGGLDDVTLPKESFDAVAAIQTLEHLPRPVAALEALRGLARPGGLVAIEVPNVENLFTTWSRRLGRVDGTKTLEPGDHYSYFSVASLRRCFAAAGWEPLAVEAGFHESILRGKLGPFAGPVGALSRSMRWGMSVLGIARR